MSRVRLILRVTSTVVCALGIGIAMHTYSNAKTEKAAAPLPAPMLVQQEELVRAPIEVTGITLTAADASVTSSRVVPEPPRDPETPRLGCKVATTATVAAAATVNLVVTAPCYPNERVTIHHQGMMFTGVVDTSGQLNVVVPVLAERAVFVVAFANGTGAVTTAHVPDVTQYDRVALQWSDVDGLQVHAREFGASYGDAGHVWSGIDQDASKLTNGLSGAVMRLGTIDTLKPQLVEVYTFPRQNAKKSGSIQLSIESEVTQVNCGRDVDAQVLNMTDGQSLQTRDIVFSMPGCDTVGDFLVLNNLFEDLKIAAK